MIDALLSRPAGSAPEARREFDKRLALESIDEFSFGRLRFAQVSTRGINNRFNGIGISLKQLAQEIVQVARDDPKGSEAVQWKVLQIEGQNGSRSALDGGGENMTIIWIG